MALGGLRPVGARVVLSGLVSAPHLNGQEGTLQGYDAATGRWQVDLGREEQLAVKGQNLALRRVTTEVD